MIINDNDRKYDTSKLADYSEHTRNIVNRLIYSRAISIRQLLAGSACAKLRMVELEAMIKDQDTLDRIKTCYGYSKAEINFYVKYAKENFPMMK